MIRLFTIAINIKGGTAAFAVLCLIAGCLILPGTVCAETWNVSGVEGPGNYSSLLKIPDLDAGDVIRIWGAEGYTCEGGITIRVPDVTIRQWEGSPALPLITNTSGKAPAITVRVGGVTLEGLNISGNSFDGRGAGVYVIGDMDTHLQGFTLTDSVFTDNDGTGLNGCDGVVCVGYVDNSRISGTIFENNTADDGGGMYFRDSPGATLTQMAFRNNTAENGFGGGVYFRGSDGVTLTDTTFEGNRGGELAGGAYFYDSDNVVLSDTTFKSNTAGYGGGALYFRDSEDATLTGMIFEKNVADNQSGGGVCFEESPGATLTDVIFKSNRADSGGGALFESSPRATLTEVTFENNTAGCGGGASFEISAGATLTDVAFEDNFAIIGGGVCLYGSENSVLNNTTFRNNSVSGDEEEEVGGGGALFACSDNLLLTGTTFENNTAERFGGGGAYFFESANAVIKNCLFNNENNICEVSSGAILNETALQTGTNIAGGPYLGGNVWLNDPLQQISEVGTDADFDGICDQTQEITDFGTDAFPLMYGGGTLRITATPADASVSIDGVETNRTAEGPFYIPAGEHTISLHKERYTPEEAEVSLVSGEEQSLEMSLVYNPVIWNVSSVAGPGNYTNVSEIPEIGAGDVIRIWGVEGYTYEGGFLIDAPDVLIKRWDGSPALPLITNTSGTAPAINVTADNVSLLGLNISGNSFAESAAGLSVIGDEDDHITGITVTGCVFADNKVASGQESSGAVCLYYVDDVSVSGTAFRDNQADYGGGAAFMAITGLTLTEVAFEKNAALMGGGAVFIIVSDLSMTEVSFEKNAALMGGGAVFANCGGAVLTDMTFENNTADNGGSAYVMSSDGLILTGTSFENNSVFRDGGGLYLADSENVVIKNCLFRNQDNLWADESSTGAVLNEQAPVLQTNIAGGPYLGGNVWLMDPDLNISERGVDADFDGICDQTLSVTGIGIDYYPLVYGGGSLDVTSSPAGATIHLDGMETSRTTDGLLYLRPGQYNVTVSLGGYKIPAEETVTVVAGETVSVSFAPGKEPAPASHSSGGGHSGISSGVAEKLSAGSQASFAVHNSAIYGMRVTAGKNIPEFLFTLEKTSLPDGMDTPSGDVYEYDEVGLYHTTDDSIMGAVLNFSVTKAWLSENGLAPQDVVLYRYHNETWNALPTAYVDEDVGVYYFTATSPGFSLFAIGASEGDESVVDVTPAPEAEVTTGTPTIPATARPEATGTQQSPAGFATVLIAAAGAFALVRRCG